MKTTNNPPENPPAFPTDAQRSLKHDHYEGMTLRDYFAAKAMQALVRDEPAASDFSPLAKISYTVADAMLMARQKGPQP